MMLDKKSMELLLRLGDDGLVAVIKKLASEAGLDPNSINPSKEQINGIRAALSTATDDDIKRASEMIQSFKGAKKP